MADQEQETVPAPTHRVRAGRTLNHNSRILPAGTPVALSPMQAADRGILELVEPLPKEKPAVPATPDGKAAPAAQAPGGKQ